MQSPCDDVLELGSRAALTLVPPSATSTARLTNAATPPSLGHDCTSHLLLRAGQPRLGGTSRCSGCVPTPELLAEAGTELRLRVAPAEGSYGVGERPGGALTSCVATTSGRAFIKIRGVPKCRGLGARSGRKTWIDIPEVRLPSELAAR